MKSLGRTLLFTTALGGICVALACNKPSNEIEHQAVPAEQAEPAKPQWPYQFVESKTEQAGFRNVMDLYAYSGDLDLNNLREFCLDRKEESTAEAFYYVVIFDDSANAVFPTTPFTAEYGADEEASKHIRAMYVFNKKNGFSELQHYERNMWESVANREEI